MADPRFYDNRGPFGLAELCARSSASLPKAGEVTCEVSDVASLEGARPSHLAYCSGKTMAKQLEQSLAGFCLIDAGLAENAPASMRALPCESPSHAFAAIAAAFYPEHDQPPWPATAAIDPTAQIGERVTLAWGVVIGPGAEIGDDTKVGPNTVIGRGVSVGRNCEIGAHVCLTHSYVGDGVVLLPGSKIGQSGFGFASGRGGHMKIPQLGRVILQDGAEIGASCAIARGALGDTVIGEGTKIDNLVHIAHNCHIGRNCLIAGQVGIAGSSELGDFVVLAGQVGVSDHVTIGDGARLAGRSGAIGQLPGGQDYGGVPARPVRQWRREIAAVALLARGRKRASHE